MADPRHRIAPGRFGYMEKTDFGMLPGELMPSWLRQIIDPGLQRIIEAGGDFASWIEGKHGEGVFPKLKQPMVYGMDPTTGEAIAAGGTYAVEEPFKDVEFADATWYGKADLVINRGGNQVQIGDFKVKRRWNPTEIQADADKYLPQLSSYHHLHKAKYPSIEVAKDVATIYVSQDTAKFLRAAFDAGALNSQQLLDELASTGAETSWRTDTDKFNEFKSGYSGDSSRQVLFHQAKVMSEEELKPYIQAELDFSKAIESATGHSRTELGRAFGKYGTYATPTAEDVPFWTEWYESLNYLASRYAAGQVTLGQVERGMARVQDRHGYGGARRFDDIVHESLSKKPTQGEERVVDRYNQSDELRNWQSVSDIIPGIPAGTPGMEGVRVNPETREMAIVYDDGSDFLSEYWRGQYDILPGGKLVIDGRLITPRQMDSPNPLVPSARWETAANVLPRILRTASALVPALGGGSKAAKEVRNYMLRALEPMPSVGQDLLSVSAARMAYQASMVGILSDQYTAGQVESVLRASGGTYAWRGQGRQAFDVAEYAHIPGWSYNPETGVLYAGAKPSKLEKRARQGLRHELIFPTRREEIARFQETGGGRKFRTVFDTSKMMFSPIVQRDKRGRASEYGAELGYRARAAVLGHSDVLPQGMSYTKGGMLGGIVNRTIEFSAAAGFTPLESIVRNQAGETVIGYLNDDERTPVILPLEGLDDFELMGTKLTRSGHTTRIDVKGIGSVKASSNLAKPWLGEKVMRAQASLANMIGDPLARGADILLPRRKNIRQFAYQLVSAAYAKDPIGLARKVYGEGNLRGNLAIGLTDREKALQGQYGIEHSGISMLMPVEEEHQRAFYRVAIEEATRGLRENVQLRTPLAETTRLMLESANIPMRTLSPGETVEAGGLAGGKPWYEIGVPAIYSELFMQTGIERSGDPQMSFEEIMNLVQDPSGYGEGYQRAVQEKVLPQLAKWSGHARSVYHDVLKARMLSLRETGAGPGADEIVTIEQLKDQLGDHDRSNLALRLKEATGLHGKLIQVGNMYLPPAETLAALSVVEDFKQNMPWVEGEEGKELGIQAEQVGSLLSSLHNFLMRGSGRDYMSLREAFLGTGAGEKLGVGMTQALARGVMGAKLLRGGVERPVVSYDWLEDNQVLIGDKDLQRMFGPKFDLAKLNDSLAVAGLIRRPITNIGRGGILAAQIVTTSQARERGLDVPDDFDGVATSRYIINQLSGDFDADRIFALLMSSMSSSGEEFSTDPTIQRAASLASLYSREAKDLASQMGYSSISAALGRQVDDDDLKPEDVFDLNLMYGRKYSEMAKSTEDLSEEQKIFADLVNKGARGLATGVLGTEDEWMQRAPIGEVVDAILGSTHSQMEMQRGYNRLIRDVPAYMALTGIEAGSEEGQLQRLVAFRAYQQAVDKTLFSSGIREWMNLAEGYNPYRLQGRTYIKRLGPATPKGELKGEHLELMSSKGGFNVRAIQSILESKEYWGPTRTGEEEALRGEKGIRAWAGETKPEIAAQQKAMAITSNPEMQAQIVQALMREEGASAQQVWELFGETGQERFANLWRDPGILAGPLGALVFAGMRRSAGQPVQPYMREQGTARQHERNMLDWGKVIGIAPEALALARTGESMRGVTRGLSGKGRPQDIVDNLRALSESGMYGASSILEALETEPIISRYNPAIGSPANLPRWLQPEEDEFLEEAEDAGVDLGKVDPKALEALSGRSKTSSRFLALQQEYAQMGPAARARLRAGAGRLDPNVDLYGTARRGSLPKFKGPGGGPADILGFFEQHEGGLLRTLEGAGWGETEIRQLGQIVETIAGAPDIELEDIVGAITAEETGTPEQLHQFRTQVLPALAASEPRAVLARAHMAYGLGTAPTRAAPVRAPQRAGAPAPGDDPLRQAVLQSGNIEAMESLLRSRSQSARSDWAAFYQAFPERGRAGETYADVRSWVTGAGWDPAKRGFPALAGLEAPEARREMLGRVARGGIEPGMAQVIMAMRPELMTKGMPGALGRARGLREAGIVSGTPEYEQAMKGIMELAGMDVFPEELQNTTDALKSFQSVIQDTTPALEEFETGISGILESARERQLTPGEVEQARRGLTIARAAGRAGAALAEGGITPEERAAGRTAAARAAGIERDVGAIDLAQQLLPPGVGQRIRRGMLGAEGPTAGADKLLRGIFSGWEIMRLQRQWGMTGGWAMQQVPVAAQQQMAAAQAAAVGMPMGQFQPGGMGMQMAAYQARQQAFRGQVGRAAFGAYGGLMGGAQGEGLAGLLGVAAPAAGVGLVGGSLASMLTGGALSATGVGIPLALGALLYGGVQYGKTAMGDRERMAIAAAEARRGERGPFDIEAGLSGLQMLTSDDPRAARQEAWRYGEQLTSGQLGGLSGAGRTAAMEYAARRYAPEWMDPTRAAQGVGAWRRFTPGATDVQEILQDPRFEQIALRGMEPEQMAEMAMQWNMAPEQWQDVMDQMLSVSEGAATQAEWIAGQWQALTQFGVAPEEVRAGAYEGAQTRLQRVAGGWEVAEAERGLEPLTGMQQRQLGAVGGLVEQLRMTGLAAPEVPEEPTAEWISAQWEQTPLYQAQLGLTQALIGMGAGMPQAAAATQVFGEDRGAMMQYQRFMGGDPWQVSRYAGGEMGLFGTAQFRQATAETFGGEIPPEIAGIMRDLRPIIDTQTGLKVGVASFPGFSEQLAEGMRIAARDPGARGAIALPGGGGLADWVQQIVEERGTRGLQIEQIETQRGYQEWQQGQRGRALDWQRVSQFGGQFEGFGTRGTFAIQRELRNLGRLWADFTSDFQDQQRQLQYSQFMENWQVRAERMPTGFQWQREDLAFRGAQQTMQYGWGMEDIEEALRYATGRERRKLLRQQERATIQYGMGMGQLGVQGERLDVREQWAREDLEREKRHFLERHALQDEYQSRYRWYMEQRRALEDELQAIHEFGAMFNLEQAEMALAKQIEVQARLNAINDGFLAVSTNMENIVALAQLFANASQDALAAQIAAAQAQTSSAQTAMSRYQSVVQTGAQEGWE